MKKTKNNIVRIVVIFTLLFLIFGFIGAVLFVNRYYPVEHVDIINKYSEEFDVDRTLVFALINAESRFNARAVSRAGASGLMQIMEDTAYWLAPMAGLSDFSYDQILNPDINIRLGTYYLSMLLGQFESTEAALSAYNAGQGNVRKWLENPEYSSDGVTLDFIPFPETRNYVARVVDYIKMYDFILKLLGY
ncbi:MAG: lytic transglycosylase domain-containing protein [Oscillospiraceae bacterium]|nr:lytic transglycosylase domain-containing protein [Oscillospiraceae bacterium]